MYCNDMASSGMDNGGTTDNNTIAYSGYGCNEYIYNNMTDDYSMFSCDIYEYDMN